MSNSKKVRQSVNSTLYINNSIHKLLVANSNEFKSPEFKQESAGIVSGTNWGNVPFWNNNTQQYVVMTTQITIGDNAGKTNQGIYGIAIGNNAGQTNQGIYGIAIGNNAGQTNQANNSIVLNATGNTVNCATTGLFIKPIRETSTKTSNCVNLNYDTNTGEIIALMDNSDKYFGELYYSNIQATNVIFAGAAFLMDMTANTWVPVSHELLLNENATNFTKSSTSTLVNIFAGNYYVYLNVSLLTKTANTSIGASIFVNGTQTNITGLVYNVPPNQAASLISSSGILTMSASSQITLMVNTTTTNINCLVFQCRFGAFRI